MVFRPTSFGKYVLLRRIAIGGMAEVFRAKVFGAEGFEKLVAIKRMLPHLSSDHQFVSMFINEAKLAASLSHANIVQIYDFGCIDNLYYLSMEYVRGKDVADIIRALRERGLGAPVEMACYVMIQALHGLNYAHGRTDSQGQTISLVHRDMSPHNLIVSHEGEVKILDFGIAKAKSSTVQTTGGVLKGKYSYMSPEQAHGMKVDHRTDLFSLGICFYELLTLTKMFHGQNDLSVLEKVRETNFIRPRDLNEHIPEELERLLLKALEKNPADRWESAAAWREALESFLFKSGMHYSPSWLANFMHELFREEISKEQVLASEEDSKAEDMRTEARRVARVEAIRQSVAVQQVSSPSRPPIREVEPEPSLPSRETERAALSLVRLRSERALSVADDFDSLEEVEPDQEVLPEDLPRVTAEDGDEDAMPTVELSRPMPAGRQSIPPRVRAAAPGPPLGPSAPPPPDDELDDFADTVHDDVRATDRHGGADEGESTVTVQDERRAAGGEVTGTRPLTPADLEGSLPTLRKPRTPVQPAVPNTTILPGAVLEDATVRPRDQGGERSPWRLALLVVVVAVAATAGTAFWMRANPPEPAGPGDAGGSGALPPPRPAEEEAGPPDAGAAVVEAEDAGAPEVVDAGPPVEPDAGPPQLTSGDDPGRARPPVNRRQRRKQPTCSTRGTGTLDVGVVGGWAGVYIDGVKVRNTPLVGHSLRAGLHRVELRDGGGSVIRTWTVCLRANAKLKLLHQ